MITDAMLIAAGASVSAANIWRDLLVGAAAEFHINTVARVVPWLANMAHESQDFNRLIENLNYSSDRLLQLWPCTPKRPWGFTYDEAQSFQRQPERIANRVYANRFGNGPTGSGDGWKYRGRGLIQLTFKDNYYAMGAALQLPLVDDPDRAAGVAVAARIAGQFWEFHGCNELADVMDDEGIRRAIQGGTAGLDQVRAKIDAIESALE